MQFNRKHAMTCDKRQQIDMLKDLFEQMNEINIFHAYELSRISTHTIHSVFKNKAVFD